MPTPDVPRKTSDIPEGPVLAFLFAHEDGRTWCTWGEYGKHGYQPSVQDAMPPGTPLKLQLSKMRNLVKRGLVDGCDCGCRGDFHLTEKGLDRVDPLRRPFCNLGPLLPVGPLPR